MKYVDECNAASTKKTVVAGHSFTIYFKYLRVFGERATAYPEVGIRLIWDGSVSGRDEDSTMLKQVPGVSDVPFFHLTQNEITNRFLFINNLAHFWYASKGGF